MGLAWFKVLARGGGGDVAGSDGVVVISHFGGGGGGELAEGCLRLVELRDQRSSSRYKGLGRGDGKALVDADSRG